jgi:photosystem II stability/assembly factor-like uncharacterized protein
VGNPAEVAYSDDGGTTWTTVNVDATNGAFFGGQGSLFALNYRNIWAGLTSGEVWFSSDGGLTWAEQPSANAGVNGILQVKFLDENVGLFGGYVNTLYHTSDGGDHWRALTGPFVGDIVTAMAMIDADRWWLGNEDGALWYTMDGGTTWTQRTFPVVGSPGVLGDIHFIDEYHGAFVTSGGSIYRTWNGGADWEQHTPGDDTFASGGFNAVYMCHPNLVYAVGEIGVTDATAMIYVATGGDGAR